MAQREKLDFEQLDKHCIVGHKLNEWHLRELKGAQRGLMEAQRTFSFNPFESSAYPFFRQQSRKGNILGGMRF